MYERAYVIRRTAQTAPRGSDGAAFIPCHINLGRCPKAARHTGPCQPATVPELAPPEPARAPVLGEAEVLERWLQAGPSRLPRELRANFAAQESDSGLRRPGGSRVFLTPTEHLPTSFHTILIV